MAEKDISKRVLDLYTPLSVAKEEVWRRWNDKDLRKKVEEFLGGDVPEFLREKPKAIMVRYIASPNSDFFNFINLAGLLNLDVILAEYPKDKFVAKNADKYNLCKMFFQNGKNKNGEDNVVGLNLINFNKCEGKSFDKIETSWGESLVNFHHKILEKTLPGYSENIVDISEWFDRNRDKEHTERYYLKYLSLFLCFGVLFENFLLNKTEEDFTKNKVLPSFSKLREMFGVKPLIVPLESFEDEVHICWCHYPAKIENIAKEIIKTKTNQWTSTPPKI